MSELKETYQPTRDQIKAYLKAPYHCPYCGSDDISGGDTSVDSATAFQVVECNACEREWQDVYALSQVSQADGTPFDESLPDLIDTTNALLAACKSVVNSCVHPDTAVRAVMVNLEQIRAAIALAEGRQP